jgi:hypothetical protein
MQKHKFSVMCPSELFVLSTPGPPGHKKLFIGISRPERTETHYVTSRSHRIQKHKFGVTCPDVLFVESVLGPPEHEK